MTSLDALLAFSGGGGGPSQVPPPDAHILVTDTLDASAGFILIHYLRHALQPSSAEMARNVLWVSCRADGLEHWRSIARKMVRKTLRLS